MPGVLLNILGGFGQQKAKTVIQGITRVCVDLAVPSGAVEFIAHEIQKPHWGIGEEPGSEKLKDTSP
jgi:phenylpyruvate tautomerase PptA (4-oxalocrotonate tautomerase family)